MHPIHRFKRMHILPFLTFICLFTGLIFFSTHSAQAAAVETYQANLFGTNEVPAVSTNATGHAVLALSDDMSTLHYRVQVKDIVNITKAHIHLGAKGENGSSVFTLYAGEGLFDPTHPVSGTFTLTADQVTTLQAGNYYINVHTEAHGPGEIRGQIEPMTPPTGFNAVLQGSNEVPAVDTIAVGLAKFTLADLGTLQYEVSVADIQGITKAHIHKAIAGENGSSVFTLYNGEGAFDPANAVSGSATLTAGDLVDLLTGYYYVNVHTEAHGPGEIRGQIGGAKAYQANLLGSNEVPAVASNASGRGVLALSADASTLYYRVNVNDIANITKAHIHLGAKGENGSSVFTLYDGTGTFDPNNPVASSVTVSPTHIFALASGNYYINVHTEAHGPGEIRGQIEPMTPPTGFNAVLQGGNEVPAVNTAAVGIAKFMLTDLNTLQYEVSVADIQGITKAHIHKAIAGENGSSVFTLYNGQGAFDPANAVNGSAALNAENLVDLLTGYYYVNVHTEAHGSGEIRGQIGGAKAYQASLLGSNEVPAVTSSASGRGVLALNADASTLYYRVDVSDIVDITKAHIHLGASGENGPSVFTLYNATRAFDPANPVIGSFTVTPTHIFALASGNYYINVHTAANGSGEIRGQIERYTPPTPLNTTLSGASEVPPVETNASGTVIYHFDSQSNLLQYQVSVADILNITKAHIHQGRTGANGSSVFTIYNGVGTFDTATPVGGAAMLLAENLIDLISGNYYVNVHTAANGSGEIRGQIAIDTDVDGMSDEEEGTADVNGNGIADYQEGAPTALDEADEPEISDWLFLPLIQ